MTKTSQAIKLQGMFYQHQITETGKSQNNKQRHKRPLDSVFTSQNRLLLDDFILHPYCILFITKQVKNLQVLLFDSSDICKEKLYYCCVKMNALAVQKQKLILNTDTQFPKVILSVEIFILSYVRLFNYQCQHLSFQQRDTTETVRLCATIGMSNTTFLSATVFCK